MAKRRTSHHLGTTLFGSRFRFGISLTLVGILFLAIAFTVVLFGVTGLSLIPVFNAFLPILYLDTLALVPILIVVFGLSLVLVGKGTSVQNTGTWIIIIGALLSFLFTITGGFIIGGILLIMGAAALRRRG
jgi:hypothetical protein